MITRKLNVGETIKLFSNENGFAWGENTVIKALVPEASYDMTCAGEFIIDRWDSIYPQPTSQEIKEEYNRQKIIAEVIDYLKSKDFDLIKFVCDKK